MIDIIITAFLGLGVAIVLAPFIFLYIMTFIVVWKENRQIERDFEEVYKKWGIS